MMRSVRGVVRRFISIRWGLFIGIILKTLDFPSQTSIFQPIFDISKGILNLFILGNVYNRYIDAM